MKTRTKSAVLFVACVSLMLGQSAMAQDDWKFGIGTGFSALGLDGDLAFQDSGVLAMVISTGRRNTLAMTQKMTCMPLNQRGLRDLTTAEREFSCGTAGSQ